MSMKPKTMIIYGDSGTGKTSQILHAAKYVYERYGKYTRLISADGGGWQPCQPLIDVGIIDAFDISNRVLALADLRRLSEGYWRRKSSDGHEVFESIPECRTTEREWAKIGLYALEGIASIARLMLGHIANNPEKVAFRRPYDFQQDGYTFGGLDEGHYGLVQSEIYRLMVQGFGTLPVPLIIWTSIVGRGKIKRTSETVYGPQAAGDAITAEIPAWVGDCIHLERILEKDAEKIVAWFMNHTDPGSDVNYLAKSRLTPDVVPGLFQKFPDGFLPIGFKRGIDRYLETVEDLQAKAGENWKNWKSDIDAKRSQKKDEALVASGGA
jgi:hypothetical protein